jgi:hypothetical protein
VRYLKIDAAAHRVELIEAATFREAERMCGLDPGAVDHATLVVDGDRLFRAPVNARSPRYRIAGLCVVTFSAGAAVGYFAFGRRLFEGNAIMFAFAPGGATIDIPTDTSQLTPRWFATAQEVEAAIEAGEIDRPQRTDLRWQWPQPSPIGVKVLP